MDRGLGPSEPSAELRNVASVSISKDSLSFPFAVTVSAQKARLHVQGSRVPESVSDLRQEALSTALVAKAHSCCPHTPIPTASLKHRSAASPYFREIKPLVSAVTYLMA